VLEGVREKKAIIELVGLDPLVLENPLKGVMLHALKLHHLHIETWAQGRQLDFELLLDEFIQCLLGVILEVERGLFVEEVSPPILIDLLIRPVAFERGGLELTESGAMLVVVLSHHVGFFLLLRVVIQVAFDNVVDNWVDSCWRTLGLGGHILQDLGELTVFIGVEHRELAQL